MTWTCPSCLRELADNILKEGIYGGSSLCHWCFDPNRLGNLLLKSIETTRQPVTIVNGQTTPGDILSNGKYVRNPAIKYSNWETMCEIWKSVINDKNKNIFLVTYDDTSFTISKM